MSDILQALRTRGIILSDITSDSRKVRSGSLFLAYPGEHHDGRQFIAQAIRQGAAAVVWEQQGFKWHADWQIPNLSVNGLSEQRGLVADSFYGQPSQKLLMIGVTGTNGKTSCTHWLAQGMQAAGKRAAVIGTLGNGFPNALSEAINTTPDPILLHGMLADYLRAGADTVAMEVSSHGLAQGRVNGVHFDVAVFTNLSRDHLDYHGDMDSYAAAKRKLFDWPDLQTAVLNMDDAFGQKIAAELISAGRTCLTFGFSEQAMVRGCDLQLNDHGIAMQIHAPQGQGVLSAPVLGRFNASNLLAIVATMLASGLPLAAVLDAVSQIKPVPGRMQTMGGGDQPLVVVDYAHTPDALENVLSTLREQCKGQLICVFGCGGNRDAGKRGLMGEVATRLADQVIVTSDNPRDETPDSIISNILSGISGQASHIEIEPDRAAAIQQAILSAKADDIVLLAGKGHETYQEIAGVRYPFNDLEMASRYLQERQT